MGAMNYLQNVGKAPSRYGVKNLTEELCLILKDQGYHWDVERLKPTPLDILLDKTKLFNYFVVNKLKDKNRSALAKVILEHDFGILFLTGSINLLDKEQVPVGTKLVCRSETSSKDQEHVLSAIQEAQSNVEAYVDRVNKLLSSDIHSIHTSSQIIEYFVQTNQSATAEAMVTFPQGIGWILKSIAKLEQNTAHRKKMDKVILWGGTIIGIGLTITGFAAPEGVAILASTAGVIKGLSSGTYFATRASQEKTFAKEMRLAKDGNAVFSEENLKFHFKNYKRMKVSYMKEFACSATGFFKLHDLALKQTSGNISKAHSLLKKVFNAAAETKSQALEQLQSMIIEQSKFF
jgi:hypothetical protein